MERAQIVEKVSEVMKDVFDLDDLHLTDSSSAADIEEWDSLSHVRLMISLERAFKIKFRNEEIAETKNVGELMDIIQKKLAVEL